MEPLLLRVEEVCQVIGLGKSKTWDLINQGVIPSIKIGKSRRVSVAALERWIADQTGESASGEQDKGAA